MLAQHTANCWVSASSPLSYFLLCVPNSDKHLGGGEKGTFDQSLEYILSRAPRCCCWEQRREWRIQEAVAGARTYLPHGFSPDGSQTAQSRNIRDLVQVLLLFLSLLCCQQHFGGTFLRRHPTAGRGDGKSKASQMEIFHHEQAWPQD